MDHGEACRVLADFGLGEAIDPRSWHWEIDVKTGLFKHRKGNAEAEHISEVRKKLSEDERGRLDEALATIAHTWENANNEEVRRAASAIHKLLQGEEHTPKGFSVYDPPIEEYTNASADTLGYPDDVKFAERRGGLLQSCREAVNYRLHKGKEDFSNYYITRTVAIYYADGKEYCIAFDDDPHDNILLTNDYAAKVPRARVQHAIERAQHTGRTITVAEGDRDSLATARCIIGDHAERYDRFLQKHRNRELKTWLLKDTSLRNLSQSTVVCRRVGLGFGFNYDLIFADILHDDGHARGVQKISIGNGGHIYYVSVILNKRFRGKYSVSSIDNHIAKAAGHLSKDHRRLFLALAGQIQSPDRLEQELTTLSEACNTAEFTEEQIPYILEVEEAYEVPTQTIQEFLEYMQHCFESFKGAEKENFGDLCRISWIEQYKNVFADFLLPVTKSQGPASFLCFRQYNEIHKKSLGLQTQDDIDLLRDITTKAGYKAADFLEHILMAGLKEHIIETPISRERDILLSFLENSPAYLIELYERYTQLYLSDYPEKIQRMEELFKNVHRIKKQLREGIIDPNADLDLIVGILHSMFSPEMTVPRESYKQFIQQRGDRQKDIPPALNRLMEKTVKMSKGVYKLKKGTTLQTEAWQQLTQIVQEDKERTMQPTHLGIAMLKATAENTIQQERKQYLAELYAYSKENGESLPSFASDFETLMKYKEFIGDRLNDLISTVLIAALQEHPEKYRQYAGQLENNRGYQGLAKTLAGLWHANIPQDKKLERIKSILEHNNILAEEIDWQPGWQAPDILSWLESQEHKIVKKGLVAKLKHALTGGEYERMQEEMKKFKFNKEGRSTGGQKFTFTLSKRHAHAIAMFNMGICVAPDDKLWNSPDMWQLIIFDKNNNAMGGTIYRTIEEQNKRYLVLSIQPSGNLLNRTSATQVYDKIIQYSRLMKKLLKYNGILIPTSSAIHSNRGSIQQEIAGREYPKIQLHSHQFSYDPYSYSYKEFYVI